MTDTATDPLAKTARAHEDGWRLGMVEGALGELEHLASLDPVRLRLVVRERYAELVRRFGTLAERLGAARPFVQKAITGHTPWEAWEGGTANPGPVQDPRPAAAPTSSCESCGAPVVWVVTTAGKRCPLDPAVLHVYGGTDPESPKAKLVLMTDAGEVVRGPRASASEIEAFPGRCEAGRVSHFATCPDAARHRKQPAAR